MALSAIFASASSFTLAGDYTDRYVVGVVVKADCGADGLKYGVVTGAVYADPITTVSLTMHTGQLTSNLTTVQRSNDTPASICNHAAQHMEGGRDALTVADFGGVPATRKITCTAPLVISGSGDFSADRQMSVRDATTTETGVVMLATVEEGLLGGNITLVMSPYVTSRLIQQETPDATTSRRGMVTLSTDSTTITGTDTAKVPPVSAVRAAYNSWQRDDAGRFPGLIQPAYNLYAPSLALPATTTFTRGSTAWDLSQAPAVKSYATNLPRWSYDASGNLLGLRLEGAVTRMNTVAALPTAPENVTVTNVLHTISFYGTGAVALSGTHTATVTGTGAFPTRTTYAFTPSAGTLTLTPSGTVQNLQLETGPFATTPILGEGSTVARSADAASVTLSGIDFNTSEGTIYVAARTPLGSPAGANTQAVLQIDDGSANNRILIDRNSSNQIRYIVISGGTTVAAIVLAAVAEATNFKMTFSWKANEFLAALNAGTDSADTAGAVPTGLTTMRLGVSLSSNLPWFGTIKHLAYFPRALTAAQRLAMAM